MAETKTPGAGPDTLSGYQMWDRLQVTEDRQIIHAETQRRLGQLIHQESGGWSTDPSSGGSYAAALDAINHLYEQRCEQEAKNLNRLYGLKFSQPPALTGLSALHNVNVAVTNKAVTPDQAQLWLYRVAEPHACVLNCPDTKEHVNNLRANHVQQNQGGFPVVYSHAASGHSSAPALAVVAVSEQRMAMARAIAR
ncbi:hypothetical protein [Nesterenkonia alkaliphila]|uniref:Uncharacterized protein n=1 Tax=Nesterenkonia alkaliphila TaxID=1463631 RepID=A0A7K1UI05_9MICC|nr:hypothetical protein [Nesterenkonia alkaliphila]MVT25731.1 hypothetical protein [Nesterenkonia alkaliphila]GFZ85401.1 hypothetical protein GCM10011359_13180 [Nesterenkonia alkaliphila]